MMKCREKKKLNESKTMWLKSEWSENISGPKQLCCHQNLIKEFSCAACMSILQSVYSKNLFALQTRKMEQNMQKCKLKTNKTKSNVKRREKNMVA